MVAGDDGFLEQFCRPRKCFLEKRPFLFCNAQKLTLTSTGNRDAKQKRTTGEQGHCQKPCKRPIGIILYIP